MDDGNGDQIIGLNNYERHMRRVGGRLVKTTASSTELDGVTMVHLATLAFRVDRILS